MINYENMKRMVQVLLVVNVILFVAWITTVSIGIHLKNQLLECQAQETNDE